MNRISIWVIFVSCFLILHTTKSDDEVVKNSLIDFYGKLSDSSSPTVSDIGWNLSSDPCKGQWRGITCDKTLSVSKINFNDLNLSGTFDPSVICNVGSLAVSLIAVSLNNNSLRGDNLDEIGNCTQLTHLQIGGNRCSGSLPDSLSMLKNLKVLDISANNFSGTFPDITQISGLQVLFAQNNQLTGPIPNFAFSNFKQFNLSFNNFTGSIPIGGAHFSVSSYIGNPELCGDPLPNPCHSLPSTSDPSKTKSKHISVVHILMFSGYFLIGLALFLAISLKLCRRGKTEEERTEAVNKVSSVDDSFHNPSIISGGDYKTGVSKSEVSATSADQSGVVSSSLIVLTSPVVNGLKFEDLLKAPAELLGRGKHGTVYKVVSNQGMTVAVKRIRDWTISSTEFKQRMQRLYQVQHPNVLPAIAFYCSRQEKLLVYEYQQNGSLFGVLYGTKMGRVFDWSSRLGIAATITNALAFMHEELHEEGIAHGNLKSTNILLNKNMEPCISEYGLMVDNTNDQSGTSSNNAFKADIFGLGVILLELLTGKMVQDNGVDLARWVLSVVREEWTGEVFDKSLIQEGASEERMVNLLQVAVKCVSDSPEARPSVNQVAVMVNTLKEEEERSMVSEG